MSIVDVVFNQGIEVNSFSLWEYKQTMTSVV